MPDDLTAELAKAKRIADGLQFACRLPDRKPDFFACGGPAAEAYWEYFTPARIVSLLAAVEAVLKLADTAKAKADEACDCRDCVTARDNGFTGIHRPRPYAWTLDPAKVREAITTSLSRKEGSDA